MVLDIRCTEQNFMYTYLYSSKESIRDWYMFLLWKVDTLTNTHTRTDSTQQHTLMRMWGNLYSSAPQRSFRATCHSYMSASAQSRRSNVKAKRGFCAVAGHSRARTNVTANGSHLQHKIETVCSIPVNKMTSWKQIDFWLLVLGRYTSWVLGFLTYLKM